jgi:hypothetical protein
VLVQPPCAAAEQEPTSSADHRCPRPTGPRAPALFSLRGASVWAARGRRPGPPRRRADGARRPLGRARRPAGPARGLFAGIPGITFDIRNRIDVFSAQEIDVGIWNDGDPDGLQGFEQVILVECKNWDRPVGSLEVAWFDTKLRLRGLSFGVLVAMNGITGNEHALTAAHFIVSSALQEGRSVVVLTRQEIEALRTPAQLVEMLKKKRLAVVVSGRF